MATPTAPPSLVLPTTSYWDYFDCAETYTFRGRYNTVLAPFTINPINATNASTPTNVVRLICAAAQDGISTLFLKWYQGARRRGTQIALLHSVSKYVPGMGLMVSPWDDGSFAYKGDIACTNWPSASLHQIRSMIHVPAYLVIDATLSVDTETDLLRPFSSTDTNVEPL